MNKEVKHNANYIKTLFADYYINFFDDIIIGSEVMYGTEKRLADLLILQSGRITAIEIKSKYDSFVRLKNQINEYKKTFHYVCVVLDESYINKPSKLNLIPDDVGIIIIRKDSTIKKFRKAKLQKSLQKSELLHSINIEYIKRYFDELSIKGSSDKIRSLVEKKSIKNIEVLFYAFLKHKIEPRYNLFLSQRGDYTHIDDLFLLSYPAKVIL